MTTINGFTNQAAQVIGIILEDGSRVTMTLYYRPQQNGWFFDLSWPGVKVLPVPFQARNLRLVTAGNLLRQFRDFLPVGLACFTVDNADPMTQNCFIDGTTSLVLLNPADVTAIESSVYAAP